jgi:hypothetical protein
LEFTYTKYKSTSDVAITVAWSDQLMDWKNDGITESVMQDLSEEQTMRALLSIGASQRKFMRLKISSP